MPDIPVTVLMPVYNGERYIRPAIDSILAQNFRDFEFLIIDDGSTDRTPDILRSCRDPRVRVITQSNQGVAAALQRGVQEAGGALIARMDADDISLPDRLQRQKEVLDHHPEAVLVSARHALIDAGGRLVGKSCEGGYDHGVARWLLLWQNLLTHPAVMFRKGIRGLAGLNYRPETNGVEDFDLWNRLAAAGKFIFIPEILIHYRLHPQSVNRLAGGQRQFRGYSRVITENFERYGIELAAPEAEELAVISGQTQEDPLAHSYPRLLNRLHLLLAGLTENFSRQAAVPKRTLFPVQAGQLTRWARYFIHVSRRYTLRLLWEAWRRHPGVVLTRVFGLTFLALFIPRTLVRAINRQRTQPLY